MSTGIVFLEGAHFYLRPLEESDLNQTYVQWLNDPEVNRWNSHAVFPNTWKKMRDYFASTQDTTLVVVLAIVAKDRERHIGNISLQRISWTDRNAEWAILIGEKDYWGKGIATEAGVLLVEYGFDRLNLHRIYLGTNAENIGMQRSAEKMGFKREGVRRQAMYKWGRYLDTVEYGLLRDEFYTLRDSGFYGSLLPAPRPGLAQS